MPGDTNCHEDQYCDGEYVEDIEENFGLAEHSTYVLSLIVSN